MKYVLFNPETEVDEEFEEMPPARATALNQELQDWGSRLRWVAMPGASGEHWRRRCDGVETFKETEDA